ncbi:MAG: GNAT family N-acetyltransferase [Deltaproteobacteria bacterium]|jgi:predicted GNAT family acetyltransferase|nr:GNAT family N-acetyltransferase [Deltaproteobacteria bacterium]
MEPIEWHTHPGLWLDQLMEHVDLLYTFHRSDRRRWLAVQHQVLTLAKVNAGAKNPASLWFTLGRGATKSAQRPSRIWGVALPSQRVVLTCPEIDFQDLPSQYPQVDNILREFMFQRFQPKHVIATPDFVKSLKITSSTVTHQTAWWRTPLARTNVTIDTIERLSLRRCTEADRKQIASWAEQFSKETNTRARDEALEWLNRRRLLIFEISGQSGKKPIGMAAFSGEFEDSQFGRLARISLVFVDSIFRGDGYGSEILNLMAMEATIDEISGVILFSDSANPKAHRFYSRSGFSPLGEIAEFNVNTTG